jgi:arylsulfatase A-like enzyme
VEVLTWSLAGDHRPVLFQHPPSRVALGAPPDGADCRLRFALGINEPAWSRSDGVVFRIRLDAASGGSPVFEELLDPRLAAPRWQEREVALPGPAPGAELVFETDPGPAGSRDHDHAGWASPHVVCRARARGGPRRAPAPDVILVSIDTLRADHLGVYGYAGSTSPHLDAFARESLVYENAFSPSPWTLPAHASLFTGLYPDEHRAGHDAPFVALGPEPPTLAEKLREAGYRTVGFSAGGVMSARYGLARGFDRWHEWTRASLRSVLPAVFAELGAEPERPLFLFLHTYDVHGPYAAWEERGPAPGAAAPDPEWQRVRRIGYHDYLGLDRFRGLADVVAAYDAGIAHTDAQLGRLFARLREVGSYDASLIVVTSDHGESLYERELYIGHSFSLHDEEIRVPLLVRLPGSRRTGRVPGLVSLVDVMPLVLGVAGGGPEGAAEASLRPGALTPDRSSVRGEATHTGARYLRTQDRKWITQPHPRGSPASRVPAGLADRFGWDGRAFDLVRDPAERRSTGSPEESGEAASEPLRPWLAAGDPPGLGQDPAPADAEQMERLRALGYVDSKP